MTWDDFDRWAPRSVRSGAAQLVTSGLLPEPEATARVAEQLAAQLPAGIATPLHQLCTVRSSGPDRSLVGHLWMRVRPTGQEVEAFVLDIEILPALRGRGWGRSTVLAAEQAARAAGASVVRLNVFGRNAAGVRLYDGLGYEVVGSTMTRRLEGGSPAAPTGRPAPRSVDLQPMDAERYAGFRDRRVADRAAAITRSGALSAAGARRAAADELDRLLPDGPATTDHRLWVASEGDDPVGDVWIRLGRRSDGCHAFVQELRPSRPGRLPVLVRAVECGCHGLGARSLTLSVPESLPAYDGQRRVLVEHCGFRVAAQTVSKAT